jgi:hypothetical protein
MSDFHIIETSLVRLERWRRWHRAWRGLWMGLLVGSLVWLGSMIAFKVLPISALYLTIAALTGAVFVVGGAILGAWRSTPLLDTARWADARLHLQERLSTSIELGRTSASNDWPALQIADAVHYAGRLVPNQVLPFRLPALSHWVLLVLAISAGLGLVPEYRSRAFRQKQTEKAVLREVGQHLVELARRNLSPTKPILAATRQNLTAVEHVGNQLLDAKLTRSEALRELTRVNETLRQESRQMAQTPALKRLEQAARAAANPPGGKVPSAGQKQIEDLQKSLGKQAAAADALDQLRKELQKTREAAAGLSSQPSAGDAKARDQLNNAMAA